MFLNFESLKVTAMIEETKISTVNEPDNIKSIILKHNDLTNIIII